MNFGTAVRQVVEVTKRRDKMAVIKQAVNDAVAELIRIDKFSFDRKQYDYSIPSASQSASIHFVPYSGFPNGVPRHIEVIASDTDLNPYTEITPRKAVEAGASRKGVFYKRSDGIMIVLRARANTIKISYLEKAPVLTGDSDTHWAFEQAMSAVVQRATFYTFSAIGEDRDAARYERRSELAYQQIALDLT